MIQYPYSYGDELTDKEARENLEYFISRYGYSLVLILLTAPILSVANDSQIQSLTQSFHSNQGKVTVDHKPTVHTIVANITQLLQIKVFRVQSQVLFVFNPAILYLAFYVVQCSSFQ